MKLMVLLMGLLLVPLTFALSQPQSSEDLVFSVEQPDALSTTIAGQTCYELYKTTEGYCSSQIRIFYQCLARTNGLEWVQSSENCGNYNGRCVIDDGRATCVMGGSSGFSMNYIFVGIGVIVVLYFLFKKKK